MTRLASNEQASILQGHKATMTHVIEKNGSNDQADIQQELKATTTNMIKKKASNEQAFSQEGHTARIE